MKVERMVLGQIQTNCYFAINEATKETIVIDPADRPDSVLRKAVDEGLTLKAIFLTHGHADHMLGVPELKAKLGIPVYACEAEKALLADPAQNLSPALFRKSVSFAADVWVKDEEKIEVAGMKFRVFATPAIRRAAAVITARKRAYCSPAIPCSQDPWVVLISRAEA